MQHLPGTQVPGGGAGGAGAGVAGSAGAGVVGLGLGMGMGVGIGAGAGAGAGIPAGVAVGGPSTSGGWTPYGLGIGVGSASPSAAAAAGGLASPLRGDDEAGRKRRRLRYAADLEDAEEGRGKHRMTNTSLMAAVLEESRRMAVQEDEKRRREEGPEGTEEGTKQDGEAHEEGNVEEASEAAAPRRSSRRPGTNGASLATTHRQTRSSPSPTPSFSSSTSSSASTAYRPILPDLELARTIFAARATRNWCDALAAGGGQTVQGPGVNPATAGQVMMAGTGGMQREGEVVAEFLYAIKVKSESRPERGGTTWLTCVRVIDRALKIAHEPVQAMFQHML
ncbi:hypothetical protein QFC19_009038 [Naganishia cerealis]|uniref:Uncharacterized protein n=1 Tax=Naganishia cerealis TaxID=610337 RepID=A0ACC2UX97_9TREE|nr:hypothetical protein QFC19_009038 [Naganishia cerealis]